jgi:ferric-dicitrate binding protein FerR (iron transport regulator)
MENNTQYIIAYLENRLSANERKAFERLLDSSAGLRQELTEIRFIWEISAELKRHKRIDTMENWKELSRRITVDRYQRKLWSFLRNVAAVLFIPLIITTMLLFEDIKKQERCEVIEQVELTSAYGIVTKIMLPDSSEVWLNSGSKLSYPQRFTGGARNVSLSGEAYFKVKADKTNLFEVQTEDGIKVSAYGTEFNVCAYDEDSIAEATLIDGNVVVTLAGGDGGISSSGGNMKAFPPENGKSNTITLAKGRQVIFNKNNDSFVTANVNLAVKTSWKEGKIIFRRANMAEIARRFSRHFNVDIRLDGEELHDYEYSATFTTETLEEIVALLEKSAPIKCKIIYPEQSHDYTFTKKTLIISMRQK